MNPHNKIHHVHTPRQARIGLAIHAAAYASVMSILAAINLTSNQDLWFQWPLLGWGAGLAWHAWVVASHVGLRPNSQGSNES